MVKSINTIIKASFRKDRLSLLIVLLVYVFVVLFSLNHCYFWDNVQQTSREAHWFYDNNFLSLILPDYSENKEIFNTGYHPPLAGIMTALLWKIFGMHLWVSHLFIALWALIFAYNAFKLLKLLLPDEITSFILPVFLLDSTILAQISIASPDIILLASFILCVRAIFEKRWFILTVSLFFLVFINGRGILAGGAVFVLYLIQPGILTKDKFSAGMLIRVILPFVPAFLLLGLYYGYYFSSKGWTFNDTNSPWALGWERPEGAGGVIKNLASYGLRLAENGRVVIWLLGLFALLGLLHREKIKSLFKGVNLSLIILFSLLFIFFLYFAISTRLVIGSRYYMGMFFIFSILVFRILADLISFRTIKIVSFVALVFLITGNFWIYPDKVAKAWDATLGHWPYYELRNECLNYLEINKFDLSKVSGGFCFKGNQRYVDLKDRDLYISDVPDNKYFIYSNISNPDDDVINEFSSRGKWEKIQNFKKGCIFVSIYQNRYFKDDE